jgi:sialate O-acetylesterase
MFNSLLNAGSIRCRRGYALAAALLLFSFSGFADVRLPAMFSDHMVVQRQRPVHVWGMADRAEAVSVSFRGETKSAVADYLGRWEVYLSPGAAGGPFELTLKGNNTIALHDVMVGDVWLASGQSNMEFPMRKVANAEAEIARANYPQIRLLLVEKNHSDYPVSDVVAAPWTECTPDSVQDFSAVAYFFGREINQRENVPIGLIDATWGGTPVEAWTSLSALSADAGMMPVFAARAAVMKKQEVSLMMAADEDRQIDEANSAGKPVPVFPWRGDMDSWAPGAPL